MSPSVRKRGIFLGVECVTSETHKSLSGTVGAKNVRWSDLFFTLEGYPAMVLTIGP